MLPLTSLLASILALFYFWLSIEVIKRRRRHRVLIGTGGESDLEWAVRAHANFAEYVPITLLLYACAEVNQTPWWLLAMFAVMLLVGRAVHAYGFLYAKERVDLRITGMQFTFLTLTGLAFWNIGYLAYSRFVG